MGSIVLLRTEISILSSYPPEIVVRAPPLHRRSHPPPLRRQPLSLITANLSKPHSPHLGSAVTPSLSSSRTSVSEASDSNVLISPSHLLSGLPLFKAQNFLPSLSGIAVSGLVEKRCSSDESSFTHPSIFIAPPFTTSLSFGQPKLHVLLLAGERTAELYVSVISNFLILVRRCTNLGLAHDFSVASSILKLLLLEKLVYELKLSSLWERFLVLFLAGERTTGLVVPVFDFTSISVRRCIILGMAHHLIVSSFVLQLLVSLGLDYELALSSLWRRVCSPTSLSKRVDSFPESPPGTFPNFFTDLSSRVEATGFVPTNSIGKNLFLTSQGIVTINPSGSAGKSSSTHLSFGSDPLSVFFEVLHGDIFVLCFNVFNMCCTVQRGCLIPSHVVFWKFT